MALLGKQASLKVGGTSTGAILEPMSDSGDGMTWQITNAAKRAIDPDGALFEVRVNSSLAAASSYTVDCAHGRITFGESKAGSTVVISCYYLPLLTVAEANAADVDIGYSTVDASRFGDATDRLLPNRAYCNVTLEHLHADSTDIDSGAATQTWRSMRGNIVFLEVREEENGEALRGWFLLESNKKSISISEAIGNSVTARGVVRDCKGRTEQALFSWA